MQEYIHGYNQKEAVRLNDQADVLVNLLHYDSIWEDNSLILEAGCGVGAQTKIIAPKNLRSKFISIDISNKSIIQARNLTDSLGIKNVEFNQADIYNLPFYDDSFDHLFICFVLEHLSDPLEGLKELKRILKPGGSVMVIEGDHGSAYFYPDSNESKKAIQCQVELQSYSGGDANIGRRLYPLLSKSDFENVIVSPRMVYADDSKPELVEGFTKNTFTAMIEGVAEIAIAKGLITAEEMKKGINDLYTTAKGGGTFCYTFFKGIGMKR
jgi:ubiquinone/menaquinone biosynthesis C-methylase UbiE